MEEYKWAHPYNWFSEWIEKADEKRLREYLRILAGRLDGDQIQDLFEKEMDEDGYFDPL